MTAESTNLILPQRWQWVWRWGAPIVTLAALGWIVVTCLVNPGIAFLPPGPGQWIVYPLPARFAIYTAIPLTGTFRHSFVLSETPGPASLAWRCLTNGQVIINGKTVPFASSSQNWKTISRMDVGSFLRTGSNEIAVAVVNQMGPPALSLKLESGDFSLASDETWQVSVSGSDWRAARAASDTPVPGKGNHFELLETTGGAFRRCWPWLCLWAVASACGVGLMQFWMARVKGRPPWKVMLISLSAAWLLLFLHNIPHAPAVCGFDVLDHLSYVKYIQAHRALPSSAKGWEMFQPPLYYLLSAEVLGWARCRVFEASGAMVLRYLSWVIGAANLALVYVGLRLMFPGDAKKPLAGLILAAFLPAQLYLLHYMTNETLAAMLVTASLCVGLYVLQTGPPGWDWHGLLGVTLGLALLSKASAALALPAVLGTLAVQLMIRGERRPQAWVKAIVMPLAICLMLSGSHYWKLWRDFGNPLTGNWNPKVTQGWWQAQGYQTPHYFLTFGRALTHPFLSGLHGFWDGLFTTLWGDGLVGGRSDFWSRPPWNYDWMAMGFVLALAPMTLVLTGLARVLKTCFSAADLSWLMLLAVGWLYGFAIVAMSLKVPSYAQVKAFYGLPALLPFCALGAAGFEYWTARGKVVSYVVGTVLGLWLICVYATFWIRPNTFQNEFSFAMGQMPLEGDHSEAFLKVLARRPNDAQATRWLAVCESQKDPRQAVDLLQAALQNNHDNARLELSLAEALQLCGRPDDAVAHARRAAELAPENELGAQTVCSLEVDRTNYQGAIVAGREALAVNPTDPGTHLNLGTALLNTGQIPEAISQFTAIVDLPRTGPEAEYGLARCFLRQRGKREEGLAHLREAVRLKPGNEQWQAELQKALEGH